MVIHSGVDAVYSQVDTLNLQLKPVNFRGREITKLVTPNKLRPNKVIETFLQKVRRSSWEVAEKREEDEQYFDHLISCFTKDQSKFLQRRRVDPC